MSFRPNMTAFTQGIRATDALLWREWKGVVADLWHARGEAGGCGHYVSPDPRVIVFLDDGVSAIRLSHHPEGKTLPFPPRIAFIPAGMPIWSRIVEPGSFRHLDLHFDRHALEQRLTEELGYSSAVAALDRPVVLDRHHAVERLAGLIEIEITEPAQHGLYLEGIGQAILSCLIAPEQAASASPVRGGLTPQQMRRLDEFMQENLSRRVPVSEMADHVGLSESWFARAFKQTTGETPLSWQHRIRIDSAKDLLARPEIPLAEVSNAIGFADQAHLTRVFKLVTGTTPAVWRRRHSE